MWYFEQAGTDGTWQPVKSADRPTVKRGRMVRAGGVGPRVRAIHEVPKYLNHLDLDQLRQMFSPDGNFAAMNDVKREAGHAQ